MKRRRSMIRHSIKQNAQDLKAWIAVGLFYLLLAALGHGCPIRWLTGIPCPGCGLSRAYLALLSGNLQGDFVFHPLFWAVPEGGKNCQAIIDLSGCCFFAGIYLEAGIRGSVHGDFCRSKFAFSDLENDRRRSFRITLRN